MEHRPPSSLPCAEGSCFSGQNKLKGKERMSRLPESGQLLPTSVSPAASLRGVTQLGSTPLDPLPLAEPLTRAPAAAANEVMHKS